MPNKEADGDLEEKFKEWNPMQDDFNNLKFNKYSSGPGVNLEPALHSKEQKGQQKRLQGTDSEGAGITSAPVPYLVFKNLPSGMTKNVIRNICTRYGRVTGVRDSTKNDYIFVDLATISDMEAVYRALENNTYGFRLIIGKQSGSSKQVNKQTNEKNLNVTGTENKHSLEWLTNTNSVDLENRNYRISGKNLSRPKFVNAPLVSSKDYEMQDSLLQRKDPHRQYLIEDDAHTLERAGLSDNSEFKLENSKYKFHTGRAYIKMPQKTKTFIEEKAKQSNGYYNVTQQRYQTNYNTDVTKKLSNLSKCAQCDCLCNSVCGRCQVYFCSLECQRKAWPTHRKLCGKANSIQVIEITTDVKSKEAELVQANDDVNNSSTFVCTNTSSEFADEPASSESVVSMQRKNITPSGNLVKITSISKTNVVFIRSNTYEDNMEFFRTINELQAVGKNLKRLQQPPNCGQIVITVFEGQYNRGMILSNEDLQNLKMIYVDYGNLDIRKFEDLYAAPKKFITLPRLSNPVILKDVPNCYMTEQIRKFMYSYIGGIDMVIKYEEADFISDKGVYKVELIDETTNQNFNKMIVKLFKPKEPTDGTEVFFADYLKQRMLPTGNNVELVVMDNSLLCTGCISCTTKVWAVEIGKFQEDLQRYGDSLTEQAYTPRVDELCIAKYSLDGKWYRGRCLEIVGDGFPSIIFFDYGNIAMVDINDIRLYPAQFTYPIYTCDCEIKGLPEQCDNELVKILEKMIPHGSVILCDNVTVFEEDKFHAIELQNVIKELHDNRLL